MKKMNRLLTLSLCLLGFSLSLAGQEDPKKWTPEDIIHTEFLQSPVFSPDHQMVVWSKRRAVKKKDAFVSDLYLTRLNTKKDGKFRTVRLTNADDSDSSPSFSRDGETIYFQSGREKGKKLWSLSVFGGEPMEVATFDNGISNRQWLNDTTFAYISHEGKSKFELDNEKTKDNTVVVEDTVYWRRSRIYAYDLKAKTTKRLTTNHFPVSYYKASRDGKWIVYRTTQHPSFASDANPDPKYYLHNVATGQREEILQGLQTPSNVQFTADHKGFYFGAVRSSNPEWNGAGITELYYFDLDSKSYNKLDLQWKWAFEGSYSVIGQDVLVALANGPTDRLAFYQKDETGKAWTRSFLELGDKADHVWVSAISDDGQKVIFEHSTASQLPKYYVADAKVANGQLSFEQEEPFVDFNKKLAKKSITKSEILRWKGYNGDQVNGILYYPENYEEGKRYPLVLSIHGGPSGVDQDRWRERWSTYPQILSQRGTFVLKPNYHGSSHHGLAFVESIKKNYYTPELEDITKGLQVLNDRGMIDMDQLGVMGWSNGAILATMLTVRYPDMFKVACPGAGDVNWTSDFGTCRFGVSFDQSYFGGTPWDNVDGKTYNEAYITQSPLFEMEKVKTPTIIFHGSEDRAVPRDQGWEYYRSLQQIGQSPVRFLWFPGQPHGLRKVTHQLRKMNEEIAWIDEYLFKKKKTNNPSFKEDSPLALLLKRDKASRVGDQFGQKLEQTLVPEMVEWKKDSLWLGRFEVTNAQYAAFNSKHIFPASEANHPAMVDFAMAQAYTQWLSKKTGQPYRLPNVEESKAWHKKAHKKGAKENTLSYWAGYALTANEVSNFRQKLGEANQNLVKSVGEFPPSKLNEAEVYDLAGNVAEYDQKGGTYGYSAYDYVDPHDPAVKPMKIGFRVVKQKK